MLAKPCLLHIGLYISRDSAYFVKMKRRMAAWMSIHLAYVAMIAGYARPIDHVLDHVRGPDRLTHSALHTSLLCK